MDTGTGGIHPTGIGGVFQGSGAGGPPIRVRDVGDDPPHGQVPGKFPKYIFQTNYGDTSKATGE